MWPTSCGASACGVCKSRKSTAHGTRKLAQQSSGNYTTWERDQRGRVWLPSSLAERRPTGQPSRKALRRRPAGISRAMGSVARSRHGRIDGSFATLRRGDGYFVDRPRGSLCVGTSADDPSGCGVELRELWAGRRGAGAKFPGHAKSWGGERIGSSAAS